MTRESFCIQNVFDIALLRCKYTWYTYSTYTFTHHTHTHIHIIIAFCAISIICTCHVNNCSGTTLCRSCLETSRADVHARKASWLLYYFIYFSIGRREFLRSLDDRCDRSQPVYGARDANDLLTAKRTSGRDVWNRTFRIAITILLLYNRLVV